MKKKVKVTAKAIVNDGKGIISIIVTDNLPIPAVSTIDCYTDVEYSKGAKCYLAVNHDERISDELQQYSFLIGEVACKMVKYLNRKGPKDCIIKEKSITKTYGKIVNKIVVGFDPEYWEHGKLYIHCHLPDRKEYFEIGICKEKWIDSDRYFLSSSCCSTKLRKRLTKDEYNLVHKKLTDFVFDNINIRTKSFVKTIRC